MPMFDLKDAAGVLMEVRNCRKTFPNHYIRVMAFDSTRGVEIVAMSFIVNRPANEPGFGLARQEGHGRRCATASRLRDRHSREGERYGAERGRQVELQRCDRRHGRAAPCDRPRSRSVRTRRALRQSRRCSTSSIASWSAWRRSSSASATSPRLLVIDKLRAEQLGLAARAAVAAHVLHRQPRHRQDDGGAAHGRDPAPPGLRAQGPPGRR